MRRADLMSNHEHRFMIAEQLQELGIAPRRRSSSRWQGTPPPPSPSPRCSFATATRTA
jgi:hypothetical protein